MQPPTPPDLVTQFTEDAFATQDRICQRSKCQAPIQRGEPCHYVAAYDSTQPGKFVCEACYRWYKSKPATTIRAQVNRMCRCVDYSLSFKCLTKISQVPVPDPWDIRQSISAAQSRGMLYLFTKFQVTQHNHSFSQSTCRYGNVRFNCRHWQHWRQFTHGEFHASPSASCAVSRQTECARSIRLEECPDSSSGSTGCFQCFDGSSTRLFRLYATAFAI